MMVFLTTLLPLVGTGFGSFMKIIGGYMDRKAAIDEAREKRKLAAEIGKGKIDATFQAQVFGDSEGGAYARHTRRVLAVIGMCTLSAIGILCTIWPTVPLHTFAISPEGGRIEILFGLFSWPATNDTIVVLTTGHLALTVVTILSTIVGFYFTPGGRK